ncbi:MAG: hypothetical protein IKM13_10780 [Clostridia bacterium]|nr:hypothetical protein [Clostridia bacterium]
MRFLGGFLKTLSILLLIAATIVCTAIAVMADVMEAYLVMGGVLLVCLIVALNVWGTGMALTTAAKLKKRVAALEQRLIMAPVVPQTPVVRQAPATDPAPQSVGEENETGNEPVKEPIMTPVAPIPEKKKSKIWIPIVVVVGVLILGIVGLLVIKTLIGNLFGVQMENPVEGETQTEVILEELPPAEEVPCGMTIDSVWVDDSYQDEDGSSLKMVYLFYTLEASDSNLKIDSKYTQMIINGNMYESDHFADKAAVCKYTPNYYYGSYIRDVYVGESKKVVATFKIPEGDLEGGKEVKLQDSQIPGIDSITLYTDEFQHATASEEMAAMIDPEGFEAEMHAREEADSDTVKKVKKCLNGYYWTFYVNSTSYKIEFWEKNNFAVTTAFGTNEGTYSVRNGYVFCTYPDTGYTVEIPYSFDEAGNFDLDTIGGFDVFS